MQGRYDWPRIRSFYEAGHTFRECQARFGVSNGAWHAAVQRGVIAPRPGRPRGANGETQRLVALLLEAGLAQAEVARRLGLSPATVSHHARRLGRPRQSACARRYDWTEIQRYHDEGHSMVECRRKFGFASKTWQDAIERGALVPRPAAAPIETFLIAGRRVSRGHLKRRLLAEGLKQEHCERCGLTDWCGEPLSLCLHHVNGDRQDNRLENLQLLCPNCHSQTPNFAGRNVSRRGITVAASRSTRLDLAAPAGNGGRP